MVGSSDVFDENQAILELREDLIIFDKVTKEEPCREIK